MPCGSSRAASANGPSRAPRSPLPTVSCTAPSGPRTSTRWWPESLTTILPWLVAATLPGWLSVDTAALPAPRGWNGVRASVPSLRPRSSSAATDASSIAGSGSPGATAARVPSGRMMTSVGQLRTAYSDQMRMSLSTATGWETPYRCIAASMRWASFSASNLAEWTPITTTGSFACRSSRSRKMGRTCMQFTQQ